MRDKMTARSFENVQCEACHGPGYKSCSAFAGKQAQKPSTAQWQAVCLSCHTEKESLNFSFTKRLPRVLHGSAPDLSAMGPAERMKVLADYRRKRNLFDNPARYTGAGSCRECHPQEYGQWAATPHAAAGSGPEARAASPEKMYRYVTGSGSPGGYPEPGREGVQCEACHGPGERHIENPDARGQSYIVPLGAQCDSCVVEQICRSCHGSADDPGFDFDKAVEKVRHKNK